eukprot:INCI16260.23.p3 GENE.INCI16260.23~~INCI16260.23.p3  ORF type:complete len:216 (+),score=26.66 INCI16260.23:86-733(+)
MMEHRDEGETIVGPKFRAYWERLGEKWQDHLPHVEVSVKVKEIAQVFEKENTFHCRFCLQLDWEDPSLPPPGDDVNFRDHFLPRFEIDNSGEEIPEPEPGRNVKCKENARAALTAFYRGDLLSRADVSDFPFDIQLLEIVIKSRPFHFKGEKRYIVLDNPTTFRPTEGAARACFEAPTSPLSGSHRFFFRAGGNDGGCEEGDGSNRHAAVAETLL